MVYHFITPYSFKTALNAKIDVFAIFLQTLDSFIKKKKGRQAINLSRVSKTTMWKLWDDISLYNPPQLKNWWETPD